MYKETNWIVYLLRCNDNSLYCGITHNLKQRLEKHKKGKGSKYVRSKLPFYLVYEEIKNNKADALKREIEIKKMSKCAKEIMIKKSRI